MVSPIQKDILRFIEERCAHAEPPTFREIQKEFDFGCVGTVQDHIRALEKKGLLEPAKPGMRRRGITPMGYRKPGIRKIPIIGQIAAGHPVEAFQEENGGLVVEGLSANREYFVLIVKGDSMIEASILDGDLAVIEKTDSVKSGEIVAALVEGESTLKTFRRDGKEIFLVPQNSSMKPIKITNRDTKIQGKLVLIQRRVT